MISVPAQFCTIKVATMGYPVELGFPQANSHTLPPRIQKEAAAHIAAFGTYTSAQVMQKPQHIPQWFPERQSAE